MTSILETIKKMLGLSAEQKEFDIDIIIHINSVLSKLNELGVGTEKTFSIQDEFALWDDFLPEDDNSFNDVKTYMYIKVKLIFDPPASSAAMKAMEETAKELEWRLNCKAENLKNKEE